MKQALGLVEIRGLSTAIVVADTMAKAANVEILEIENTKGLGYMSIKITGDVGAVNAAVQAGCQIGITNQKLVSSKVIPRPSDYVENTFCRPPEQPKPAAKEEKVPEPKEPEAEPIEEVEEEPKEPEVEPIEEVEEEPKEAEAKEKTEEAELKEPEAKSVTEVEPEPKQEILEEAKTERLAEPEQNSEPKVLDNELEAEAAAEPEGQAKRASTRKSSKKNAPGRKKGKETT